MLVIGSTMAKMKPRVKIPIEFKEEPYLLVRERDGLTIKGHKIGWVEWDEDKKFKGILDEITIGSSLIVDPHRLSYTWLTTVVVEILDRSENYIKFRTSNSVYELTKLA